MPNREGDILFHVHRYYINFSMAFLDSLHYEMCIVPSKIMENYREFVAFLRNLVVKIAVRMSCSAKFPGEVAVISNLT